MEIRNLKSLISRWDTLITRVKDREEISEKQLQSILLETYNVFLVLQGQNLVPREVFCLILKLQELESTVTLVEETPACRFYTGIYHLQAALVNGFFNGAYESEFLHLRVTPEGVQVIPLAGERNWYLLNLETADPETFSRFLTGDIEGNYDGLRLV